MTDSEMPIDGLLEITNESEFSVAYSKDWTEYYNPYDLQVEAYDIKLDHSTLTLNDERPIKDANGNPIKDSDDEDIALSTMAAKDKLIISNSTVKLNANSVLAFNGEVYDEDDDDDGTIHTVASLGRYPNLHSGYLAVRFFQA